MAFTAQQEQQIKDILARYSEVLDVAEASTDILAALGYGDVRVIDLPTANPIAAPDTLYLAQSGSDVQATTQQLGQFIYDQFLATALAAALAQQMQEINAALDPTQSYFIGQA